MEDLGSKLVEQFYYRTSWVFIGKKGSGTCVEMRNDNQENVFSFIEKTFEVSGELDEITEEDPVE